MTCPRSHRVVTDCLGGRARVGTKGLLLSPFFGLPSTGWGVRNVSFLRRQHPLLTSGDYAGKRKRESQVVLGGIRGFQREQAESEEGACRTPTSQEGKLWPPRFPLDPRFPRLSPFCSFPTFLHKHTLHSILSPSSPSPATPVHLNTPTPPAVLHHGLPRPFPPNPPFPLLGSSP